jgi:hypothetical protein
MNLTLLIDEIVEWLKQPIDTPRWFLVFILAIIYVAEWMNSRDER